MWIDTTEYFETPRIAVMREEWNRTTSVIDLTGAELTALIQPAFPGQTVVESVLAEGGLANTNIRVRLSRHDAPLLLRLFVRSPCEARKEVTLSRFVGPHVPSPRFLFFAEANPITGHPYALMEWVVGQRLEVVAPRLAAEQAVKLGRAIGKGLAAIHAICFPQAGFLDADLNVALPIPLGSDGLVGYLRLCLIEGHGQERLGQELTQAVLAVAQGEGRLLDAWQGNPCLVHGDFGGSNILVRETPLGWVPAAYLDWEFAFSGSPFFDLGNLLRPPLGDREGFAEAVHYGYSAAGGVLPQRWRQMSLLTDLLSWADFVNRPRANAALIRDAKGMIRRTLRAFDSGVN